MDERLFVDIPGIDCTLRWEDALLPASLSEADLDRIIFAEMTFQLRKTALVIVKAVTRCEALGLPVDADLIGASGGAGRGRSDRQRRQRPQMALQRIAIEELIL